MNLAAVDAASQMCAARGMRILNGHLFADTEEGHAGALLALIDPKPGAVILDAGCGFGEAARLMRDIRPDLTFKLLNVSRAQLDECPVDMDLIEADFSAVPLPDGCVDVVMFNYSISHAPDWVEVLREANRVLREGGTLFINDMMRQDAAGNELFEMVLGARAHQSWRVEGWAKQAGFSLAQGFVHRNTVQRMRGVFQDPALYDCIMANVVPATWKFTKTTVEGHVESAFARHDRIGFQFSGGRDSTAALYLLRPYWDRMTVYHLDTGDQFPETRAVVEAVERDVQVVRVVSNVRADREQHGIPSDLVPVDNGFFGRKVSGQKLKVQSRYDCCYRSLMKPMHDRMLEDGITLLVRGQRDNDYSSQPMRSGDVQNGQEVLYPIQEWDAEMVMQYITDNNLPVAPFYERGMSHGSDCMGCTAWWDDGHGEYLRKHHPEHHVIYLKGIDEISAAIKKQASFAPELDLG